MCLFCPCLDAHVGSRSCSAPVVASPGILTESMLGTEDGRGWDPLCLGKAGPTGLWSTGFYQNHKERDSG